MLSFNKLSNYCFIYEKEENLRKNDYRHVIKQLGTRNLLIRYYIIISTIEHDTCKKSW